jgi:DNA integrity scanning protein DisA with diadenylate cyclase activity
MKSESTYKPASIVAETVEAIFTKHVATATNIGEQNLADVPSASIIESIIDVAFWTSLRHEEGRSPKISLAYLKPEQAGIPILFEKGIILTPAALTKLSAGYERAGVHLGIWAEDDIIYVWGATLSIPNCCFVLDVSEPGLVVIKHRRIDGFGKFSNIAVLAGNEIKIVDEQNSTNGSCPKIVSSLLDFSSTTSRNDTVNVMLQLAVSMRSHKRGGTILMVPTKTKEWRESISHPLHYSIKPAFSGLSDLIKRNEIDNSIENWQVFLAKEVDIIAGLTAIDGATIINDEYKLLAFGEKIVRRINQPIIEKVIETEPIKEHIPKIVFPSKTGGTRHMSAAQFVQDQTNAIALVASQDGRFTVFAWSAEDQLVQAHRIDCLLL